MNQFFTRRYFGTTSLVTLAILTAAFRPTPGRTQNRDVHSVPKDQTVIIQSTPEPKVPAEITTDIELRVTLLVTFKKNGKVTDVKVMSSQVPAFIPNPVLDRLEQATMEAARKIEFAPAVKDGHRISQRAILEFTYKRVKNKKYFEWQPGQLIAEVTNRAKAS